MSFVSWLHISSVRQCNLPQSLLQLRWLSYPMSNFMLQLSKGTSCQVLDAAVSQWDFPRDINIAYNSLEDKGNSIYCILLTEWVLPCVSDSPGGHCKAICYSRIRRELVFEKTSIGTYVVLALHLTYTRCSDTAFSYIAVSVYSSPTAKCPYDMASYKT